MAPATFASETSKMVARPAEGSWWDEFWYGPTVVDGCPVEQIEVTGWGGIYCKPGSYPVAQPSARTRADFGDWAGSGPLDAGSTTGNAVDIPTYKEGRRIEAGSGGDFIGRGIGAAYDSVKGVASDLHGVILQDVLLVAGIAVVLLLVAGHALPPALRALR